MRPCSSVGFSELTGGREFKPEVRMTESGPWDICSCSEVRRPAGPIGDEALTSVPAFIIGYLMDSVSARSASPCPSSQGAG